MSIGTALLVLIGSAFLSGLVGWLLNAAPIEDPLQDEIGDYPRLDDLP